MTKQACCSWCQAFVEVKDTYDELQHVVYCCDGCRDADTVFQIWQSDEAIHKDRHYHELTRGEDDEQG